MDILLRALEPGQTYALQVRAKNKDGLTSPWSTVYSLLTVSDTVAPKPVTGLSWTVSGSSFVGTWVKPTQDANNNPLKDFKDYKIIITAASTSIVYFVTQEKFDLPFEINRNSFTTAQPTVQISVQARDLVGNLSTAVIASATNPVPANVAGLTATNINLGVDLKWDANTDADLKYYQVHMSTSGSGFTPGPSNLVWTGTATNYTHTSSNGVVHYFKVAAVDVFDQLSAAYTSASGTPNLTSDVDVTPAGAPATVTVTSSAGTNGTSTITVNWSAVVSTKLSDYRIRYSTDGSTWQYVTVPKTDTSALLTNLLPSTTYYVGVASLTFANVLSSYTNANTYPITSAADTTAPSQPSVPTVSVSTLAAQVTHDMTKQGGGNLEADVDYLEVHASINSSFTPNSSTLQGTLSTAGQGVVVGGMFYFNTTTSTANLYWRVIAVDRQKNKSAHSNTTTGLPGLIQSANFADATITSAKIINLNANQIVAGTGIINDLLIKSNLTIDTAGHLKSSNYNAGAQTGYTLDTTGLTIYDGSVYAKSLILQDSQNIVPVPFADFEFNTDYYHTSAGAPNPLSSSVIGSLTLAITSSDKRFNRQALRLHNTSLATGVGNAVYYVMSVDATDTGNFTMNVDPGTYIYSFWAKKTSTHNTRIFPGFIYESGSTVGTTHHVTSTTWTRFTGTFVVPAAKQKLKMYFAIYSTDQVGVDVHIDGIQIERKMGGIDTPSEFKPPSQTFIDGGAIVTGSIRSSAASATVVGQPAWSINTAGNMQVGDAAIRGSLIVGDVTETINFMPSPLSSFENTSSYYHDGSNNPNTTNLKPNSSSGALKVQIIASGAQSGSQTIRFWDTTAASPNTYSFGISKEGKNVIGNNVPIIAGREYMISAYVKSGDVTKNQKVYLAAYFNGTNIFVATNVLTVTSTSYTRIFGTFTGVAGFNSMQVVPFVEVTSGTGFDFIIDAIQIELKSVGQTTPTTYVSGTDGISYVKSANYLSGISGWSINSNGDVEFNNGVFRGELSIASVLGSQSYGTFVRNQSATWRETDGVVDYNISGAQPGLLFRGTAFVPGPGGTSIAGRPTQVVMRMTPEGGFHTLMDSSQNDRLFTVDGNNDLDSSFNIINDYYGYAEQRGGPGLNRDFISLVLPDSADTSDNAYYQQNTAHAQSPASVGGGSYNRSYITTAADASTSGYWYYPYSTINLQAQSSGSITSQNIIPDPWDIFDAVIGTYNSGSSRNRINLNSKGNFRDFTGRPGATANQGINATVTSAGSGTPIIWFAPTTTSYNVTVTPLAKYSMTLSFQFDSAAVSAGLQIQYVCKLSNGTILTSTALPVVLGFAGDISSASYEMRSDTNVFSIPSGITTAQFGFQILGTVSSNHDFSFGSGRLYKTVEPDGTRRSTYNTSAIMSREETYSRTSYAGITVTSNQFAPETTNLVDWGSHINLYATQHDDFSSVSMTPKGFQWGSDTEPRSQNGLAWRNVSVSQTIEPGIEIVPANTPSIYNETPSNAGGIGGQMYWSSNGDVTEHNGSGQVFIVQRAGLYVAHMQIQFTTIPNAAYFIEIYNITKSRLIGQRLGNTATSFQNETALFTASVGDRIAIRVNNQTGSNMVVGGCQILFAQII